MAEESLCLEELPVEDRDRLAVLRESFPDSECAELLRFSRARRCKPVDEAIAMYREHLTWRQGQGSALRLLEAARAIPPKYVRALGGAAIDGTPTFHIQGAMFDDSIADAESYILACASALEAAVSRADETKVTALIDVRCGEGLKNIPAHRMIPLIKMAATVLPANYPERAQRVIIYPMPLMVLHLWRFVSQFLDPVTREKVIVLGGSDAVGSPCPAELADYVAFADLPPDLQQTHKELEKKS